MIDRRVRAFAPRPGAFALLPEELGAGRIKILESEPCSGDTIRASTSEPAPRTTPGDERRGAVDRLDRVPGIRGAAAAPGEVLVASGREGLVVAAAEGVLRVVTVQPEGRRAMDAKAFLRGYRLAAGMCFGDGLSEKRS